MNLSRLDSPLYWDMAITHEETRPSHLWYVSAF